MKQLQRLLFAMVVTSAYIVSFACPAHAWNKVGHWTVAKIAYDDLASQPALRSRLVTILKAHPIYAKVWAAQIQGAADPEASLFMLASSWPDDIKPSPKPGEVNPYRLSDMTPKSISSDLNPQHYFDAPFVVPQSTVKGVPPKQPNLHDALVKYVKMLNRGPTDQDRAIALAWILHLVGDAHQPLHCVTLFSDKQPAGDAGGNFDWVSAYEPNLNPELRGTKESLVELHAFWDDQLGTEEKLGSGVNAFNSVTSDAAALENTYPVGAIKNIKFLNPTVWIKESYTIAVADAYLNAGLAYYPATAFGDKPQSAPKLPQNYAAVAAADSQLRICLAGHRLAALLVAVIPKT